jgi:hypothetical protein
VQSQRLRAGFALALVSALGVAGCAGGTTTTTVIESTGSHVPVAKATRSHHHHANKQAPAVTTVGTDTVQTPEARPQVFHGSGQQTLGTVSVPADTTISWNCPSCSNTNFIINNAQSDVGAIPTNGLDQTEGVDTLAAGVYHTVVVDTTGGPWTVAVGTTAPPPTTQSAPPAEQSSPSTRPPSSSSALTSCDGNISVGGGGGCKFAENTFYEYWKSGSATSLSVYGPTDQQWFTVSCSPGNEVVCTTDGGATVQFSQAAIDRYTNSEAAYYASHADLG